MKKRTYLAIKSIINKYSKITNISFIKSLINRFGLKRKITQTIKKLKKLKSKYVLANIHFEQNNIYFDWAHNISLIFSEQYGGFLYKSEKEKQSIEILLQKIDKKTIFFDIGANIGIYSLIMAKEKNCKTYSFEPVKKTQELLQQNIRLNKLDNKISIEPYGLSNKDDTVFITNTLGGRNHITNHKKNTEKIIVKKLDSYIKQGRRENTVLKIDVEGHEMNVLEGGLKFIKKYKPKILVEIELKHTTKEKIKNTFNILDNLDYNCLYVLTNKKKYKYNVNKFDENLNRGNNFYFEHNEDYADNV